MSALRELITSVMADVAPDLPKKERGLAERKLIKGFATMLVSEGFTIAMAAEAMAVPVTTLYTWRDRDDEWRAELEASREHCRKWLLGMLRLHLEYAGENGMPGGRAAGSAANILANLWFAELRTSKVEAVVTSTPSPGESRAAILSLVNKGKPD